MGVCDNEMKRHVATKHHMQTNDRTTIRKLKDLTLILRFWRLQVCYESYIIQIQGLMKAVKHITSIQSEQRNDETKHFKVWL